ncbi:MAG: aminotransferase class V-fold PLP-dependent enzyme [Proteobacteria bacterium]|nr:aminotransferase class V-fold PLP-dependent enzyme [Pseudomonadota bacterium]
MKTAILLAQERSERVVNGSGHMKALAKVAGLPLIIRNLRTLHAAGIEEAVVVTGYEADKVERALNSYHIGLKVTVVRDRDWERGTAHSILAAASWITHPTLLVPSDHLYPPSLIRRFMKTPTPADATVMAVDRKQDEIFDADECMKVRLSGNIVTEIGRNLDATDAVCPGIIRISPEIVDTLHRLLEEAEVKLIDLLRSLARRGRLQALDVENARWISISSPQARRYADLLLQLHGDTLETSYVGEHAILLNPGPVATTPRVKAAVGARDMCHREPIFSNLLDSVQRKLRIVFGAQDDHDILVVTSSGTGGMEAALSTFVPRGRKLLVLRNGAFGERLVEIANTHNIDVVELGGAWGSHLPIDQLEPILQADPQIAAVAMIHHETSVGILNPVHAVGEITRRNNVLLIADAVSSLGAEDIDVTRDNVDVCVTSANKCLHAFSGLSSICVHPGAWNAIAHEPPRSYYLDLRKYQKYMNERSQTPFTPGVNTMMSLNAALDELLDLGVRARWEHYHRLNTRIREGLIELGFELLVDPQRSSHTITMVKVPEDLTYTQLYQELKTLGFIVYESKGAYAGRYFQVANMGALEEVHIDDFLNAVRHVLAELRHSETRRPLRLLSRAATY